MLKTFTITKENRVANSPFELEGSDMKIDITHEFPIPLETQAFDSKNEPITIRFIMGCKEIDKEKQIKMGFAEKRKPTAQERQMTTFLGGMLTVPDGYANLEQFLVAAPWFKGMPGKEDNINRPPHSRVLYEIYDQDQLDEDSLELEEFITQARAIILKAGRNTLVSLLRLARPGQIIDANIDLKQLKLQLLEVANSNPDFILKSVKTAKNDATVFISKAVDYGILNLDSPGKLLLASMTKKNKFEEVTRISDQGGKNSKIERTAAYFESEEGKTVFSEVKRRVQKFEKENGLDDDTETGGEKTPASTTTTQAPTTTTTTEATTTTTTTEAPNLGTQE